MKKLIVLILLSSLFISSANCQYPFDNFLYTNNLKFANPSFTGYSEKTIVATNIQSRLLKPLSENRAIHFNRLSSFETYLQKIRSGFGLSLARRKTGPSRILDFRVYYSLKVRLSEKSQLRIGLDGGMSSTKLNLESLRFPSQLDGNYWAVTPTRTSIFLTQYNISTGINYTFDKFYIGVACQGINLYQKTTSSIDIHRTPYNNLSILAGFNSIGKKFTYSPSLYAIHVNNGRYQDFNYFDINNQFGYKDIVYLLVSVRQPFETIFATNARLGMGFRAWKTFEAQFIFLEYPLHSGNHLNRLHTYELMLAARF